MHGAVGHYSSTAVAGDMIIRSLAGKNLLLQCGGSEAGLLINTNNYTALRKILKFTGVAVADDVAVMNNLIFNEGAVMGGVFAGDNFITSYWGVSVLLNSGGFTNGYGGGNNGRSYDVGWASFTVNMRTSTSVSTFDRRLFTIRPNGVMIMYNDQWHITNDNVNRFYFAANGTTYISGGSSVATDKCLIVYASSTFGYANVFCIQNNGDVGIGTANPQGYKLYVNGSGYFAGNLNNSGSLNVGTNLNVNYGDIYTNGTLTATFLSVSSTNTDYCGIQIDTTQGSQYTYPLRVLRNTFTGLHRCFIDNEELFDMNDIQKFKDDYVGRIVIATGKIATDTSDKEGNWEIKYDKEGLTIEDAVPMIKLSRTKKDKRVFGVLGDPKRSNSREERMIVNSVGEGGIMVINSNGNIENGDYIQSSGILGYGEKQDDDLLHNYTVAKATIQVDFELDSPYYNCFELEGTNYRIAFIACSYHCG